jgi:hypothetical protein
LLFEKLSNLEQLSILSNGNIFSREELARTQLEALAVYDLLSRKRPFHYLNIARASKNLEILLLSLKFRVDVNQSLVAGILERCPAVTKFIVMLHTRFDYESAVVFAETFNSEILDEDSIPKKLSELVSTNFKGYFYFQLDLEAWKMDFSQIAEVE